MLDGLTMGKNCQKVTGTSIHEFGAFVVYRVLSWAVMDNRGVASGALDGTELPDKARGIARRLKPGEREGRRDPPELQDELECSDQGAVPRCY